MKINALKKQKFYIKNSYASQIMKPQKQNIQNNAFTDNSKITINYNINQNLNFNPKKIFFNKKTLYQNCYPNKPHLVKGGFNYSSQKNINNKSFKKYKGKQISLGIISDQAISGRKMNQNTYEIINPFKDRSNSENKINCFNRTYTFFNKNNIDNNNNQITYLKVKQKENIKQPKKIVDTISINLTDISYKNIPTKLYKMSKDNSTISPINYNNNNNNNNKYNKDKLYYYQDNNPKKINKEKKNNCSKLQKQIKPMSPQIPKEANNKSITTPNSNTNSHSTLNKTSGRIKRYILNNLSDKKKIRSRQCFRQYIDPVSKTTGIENGSLNYEKYACKKTPNRRQSGNKILENASIIISPSMPSISSNIDEKSCSLKINKKYNVWMKKNKNIKNNRPQYNNNIEYDLRSNNINLNTIQNNKIYKNILELRNNLSSNINIDGLLSNIDKDEIKGIKERDLFEQSAITIQSAFRGYLIKNKFERNLYNFKGYNKGFEILEKAIYLNKYKKIFLNYLITLKKNNIFIEKNYTNCKSCKTFKLINLATSPLSDKEEICKKYKDIFLHKEIGERFNIIKENKNKEIEEKYKEELDGINNKMNKLIEENNKLKDINNNIKYKESKFMELSLDNQKKDNIINIITNDNQNLARKLKIIKDKYNKFEIHNHFDFNFICDDNKKENAKKLFITYRNFYLLFLLYKKNISLLDILRKSFLKYKNIVNDIKYNNDLNNALREQKLKYLINNKINKEYNYLKKSFVHLYNKGLINYKEIENINSLKKTKLINMIINKEKANKIIIKSFFSKFYYKGIISNLIEEKNKNIIDQKTQNENKIRKLFNYMEQRKDKHNFLIKRDCFDKWILFSKILGMKAITDEKKRKKRQKQRMKKKIENKSANKYLSNSNNILQLGKNNNINIINKEKDKEVIISLERSVTTDLSGGEVNGENKDKVIKATEKLGDIFYKAALNYKNLEKNKNKTINVNKNINRNNKKETIKQNDNENDNEEEEDSGDSFGI